MVRDINQADRRSRAPDSKTALVNHQPANLRFKGRSRYAQHGRRTIRARDLAASILQRLFDQLPFVRCERLGEPRHAPRRRRRVICERLGNVQPFFVTKDRASLQHVLELPDIARPLVADEPIEGCWLNACKVPSEPLADPAQDVLGKSRDVLTPSSQWRQVDGKYA